ncbi:hypothetical protein GH714_019063 [Hevea brasiliensis]|uniref:RING-type E3 ubiquitin transferase n=1 Tax=Hevea brasiliensis TaxID=3981 RepID=A0A6A6N8Q1_HEVBR|nr:hypothetical protein GH714_019063 [Hevea brasiliensis]
MMNFCLIYFLILVLVDHGFGFNMDECKESKCGGHGPAVRFPFRIKGQQPDSCGYPETGFDLSCSERKETVLELPTSVKLLVKKIDYVAQVIYTSDPQDCLPDSFPTSIYLLLHSGLGTLATSIIILVQTVHGEKIRSSFKCLASVLLATKFMCLVQEFPWTILPFCIVPRSKGKFCRLKANTTEPEIECYGKLRQIKWSSAKFVATG